MAAVEAVATVMAAMTTAMAAVAVMVKGVKTTINLKTATITTGVPKPTTVH